MIFFEIFFAIYSAHHIVLFIQRFIFDIQHQLFYRYTSTFGQQFLRTLWMFLIDIIQILKSKRLTYYNHQLALHTKIVRIMMSQRLNFNRFFKVRHFSSLKSNTCKTFFKGSQVMTIFVTSFREQTNDTIFE